MFCSPKDIDGAATSSEDPSDPESPTLPPPQPPGQDPSERSESGRVAGDDLVDLHRNPERREQHKRDADKDEEAEDQTAQQPVMPRISESLWAEVEGEESRHADHEAA